MYTSSNIILHRSKWPSNMPDDEKSCTKCLLLPHKIILPKIRYLEDFDHLQSIFRRIEKMTG